MYDSFSPWNDDSNCFSEASKISEGIAEAAENSILEEDRTLMFLLVGIFGAKMALFFLYRAAVKGGYDLANI